MNSKSLRRLASDQASLQRHGLPPNYLFPTTITHQSDDLTQLTVLLAGPLGTPYSSGVWRISLKCPPDYPQSAPKAVFRTRIWHPNVEESTGAVCVDTLKRDWSPQLTLRDVLVTISCLLIHPNPDSALNGAAGAALQEGDFEEFARHARLMTEVHAGVPGELREAVAEAQRRGDDVVAPPAGKKRPTLRADSGYGSSEHASAAAAAVATAVSGAASRVGEGNDVRIQPAEEGESDGEEDPSKENDPSLSPSPVSPPPPPSPLRSNVLGKRPLSALPMPTDHEGEQWAYIEDDDEDDNNNQECEDGGFFSANLKNIANNDTTSRETVANGVGPPLRKSPKLSERLKGVNASGRIRIEEGCDSATITPYVDDDAADAINRPSCSTPSSRTLPTTDPRKRDPIDKSPLLSASLPRTSATPPPSLSSSSFSALPADEKENASSFGEPSRPANPFGEKRALSTTSLPPTLAQVKNLSQKPPTSRTASNTSVSSTGSGRGMGKPRVGLRRL